MIVDNMSLCKWRLVIHFRDITFDEGLYIIQSNGMTLYGAIFARTIGSSKRPQSLKNHAQLPFLMMNK